ncbi:Outer membrane protein TolC [Persephonella hydrogeniphila]|uniref:Outer membrane protein TolC n=1 Tax=Persephonella hydrogeniphila TaxID=198703 RepID=A0A285N7C0_9AQUI|nr:TolC family protein [Persephonella hydrogeniphila]SNZ03876.1 Outer membrane protein TolC [Persephonella hydrogeniphila]
MKKISIVLLVIAVTLSGYSKELSLDEAINIALKNSYQLKAAKKKLKSKELEYKATKGIRWPTITFSEMFMRTNIPGWAMMNELNQHRLTMNSSSKYVDMTSFNILYPGMFQPPHYPEWNNWQTKIQFQVPIWAGGKIGTGIEMRKKEFEATKFDLQRTKQKVIYDVTKAYLGAVLAKEGIKLAKQAYKSVKKHYETAKVMYDNGLAIYADVLRAKVYLTKVKAKIAEAENQYLIAKRGLLLAMGVDNLDPAQIDVTGQLTFKMPEKDIKYWQEVAVSERPDLIALRTRVETARKYIDFQKADMLPTIGAFGYYQMDDRYNPFGTDGTGFTLGVALNWKIFDGFQAYNKYKAAKETYKQYSNLKKGFEEYIKFSVFKAYKELNTARNKLKAAEENLKYAEEVLKITEKRYKNQMASMIDLLDTQTMYDQIKFEKAKATYDANISLLELKYQSGKLKENNGGDK